MIDSFLLSHTPACTITLPHTTGAMSSSLPRVASPLSPRRTSLRPESATEPIKLSTIRTATGSPASVRPAPTPPSMLSPKSSSLNLGLNPTPVPAVPAARGGENADELHLRRAGSSPGLHQRENTDDNTAFFPRFTSLDVCVALTSPHKHACIQMSS